MCLIYIAFSESWKESIKFSSTVFPRGAFLERRAEVTGFITCVTFDNTAEVVCLSVMNENSVPTYFLKSSPFKLESGSLKIGSELSPKSTDLSCAEENTGVSKLVPAKTTAVVPILIKSLFDKISSGCFH